MARVGLMGCGAVADFGHLPALTKTPGLELVALYDPLISRAQAYSQKFGGVACSNTDDFFAQALDAVVICSPLPAHHDNVMLCSEQGVHVLCEKPIAENEDDAADMMAVMEDSGKGFFVGFVYRFSPVVRQLRQWMRKGEIGDVKHLRMIYMWNLHGQWVQDDAGRWVESSLWKGRMREGGPLIDCGVHQIDLIRWMTGLEVRRYDAHGAWISNYESPDYILAYLQLEGGVTASVEVSFTYGHTAKEPLSWFSYEVIGTGGVARYDRNGYVLEARNGQGILTAPGASEKDFEGMYQQFAEFVHTGKVHRMQSSRLRSR
jgi:predicted dehydrogenase